MDKRSRSVSIGITSIIVMFTVIVMTIFAVLSLSTASEEKELAERYAASVAGYWAADGECAETANELAALWRGGEGAEAAEKKARELGAETVREGEELIVSFSRPISDISELCVTLRLGAELSVERWQMVTTEDDWEPDYSIRVWKG